MDCDVIIYDVLGTKLEELEFVIKSIKSIFLLGVTLFISISILNLINFSSKEWRRRRRKNPNLSVILINMV